jgi:hypothetical protein
MECLSVSIPIAFLWESCSSDVSHGSTEGFLPVHIEAHFFCIPPDLLAFDLVYRLSLEVTNYPLCFDDSEQQRHRSQSPHHATMLGERSIRLSSQEQRY